MELVGEFITYKEENKEAIIEYIIANNIKAISIDDSRVKDLDFLVRIPFIEKIHIYEPWDKPITALENHKNLKKLLIRNLKNLKIKVSKFSLLEDLEIVDSSFVDFQNVSLNLKKVKIHNYKSIDFKDRFTDNNIETLQLTSSKITSLKCIHHFKDLKNLILAYTPKLIEVSDLIEIKDTIEGLEFENCKNVIIDEIFLQLHKIKTIEAYNIKALIDTSILKQMKNLEKVSILGNSKIEKFEKEDLNKIRYVNIPSIGYLRR